MTELDTLDPEPSDVEMDAFESRSMADCTVGTFSTVLVATIAHALIERDAAIAALEGKVDAFERRIQELEARPVIRDAGIWRTNTVYASGTITTFKNSAWFCSATHLSTGTEPDHKCFRLIARGVR